jgi:hypothetical protein
MYIRTTGSGHRTPSTKRSQLNIVTKQISMSDFLVTIAIVRTIELLGANRALKLLLRCVHGIVMALDIFLFDRFIAAAWKVAGISDELWIVLAMDMAAG